MPSKAYLYMMVLCSASLVITGCGGGSDIPQEDGFPVLTGNYLGQSRPGIEPELFAPGIISDPMHNRDVAISFEGDEMYFGLANAGVVTIIWTRRVDGQWTKPDVAPFASDPGIFDFEPCISNYVLSLGRNLILTKKPGQAHGGRGPESCPYRVASRPDGVADDPDIGALDIGPHRIARGQLELMKGVACHQNAEGHVMGLEPEK